MLENVLIVRILTVWLIWKFGR